MTPILMLFSGIRNTLANDELGWEILNISLPTTLALAADPIASLIDTAFIGHIGPVELAAVGVSIAIFNQISKITIIPLVSVTTSLVAEEDATDEVRSEKEMLIKDSSVNVDEKLDVQDQAEKGGSSSSTNVDKEANKLGQDKSYIPSASSGIVIGGVLGVLQALFIIFTAKPLLNYMGLHSNFPMFKPAQQYLTLRSFGAPAVIISMAIQGVFRGIKDTRTPLYATVIGDVTNVILDPLLMFVLRLGVSGAAIAHIISQYLISIILLWSLVKQVVLLPPSIQDFQFGKILKNGFLLLIKVAAVTFCVTLSASLAARQGSITMAAFQICLQIWMATSLLADGLAVAGQAIIASAFARKDYQKVITSASRVLLLGLMLGLGLSILLLSILPFASKLFTNDINVLQLISIGIPYVAATQPINVLAFIFDGLNYGASDFSYSAYSMIMVALVSIFCLFMLSSSLGFTGIWIALSIYMTLRIFAGFWRIGTGSGPWSFLKNQDLSLQ
ncbi:protein DETOXIFICATION 42 isoform X1 [Cajanus cajan]|uniref:protein DETOXIFICATION 42 isoform X1 n=1 Tax=Cajanus cajan TaxID=3821 RepID=UPI00098D772F|nr:protein DETOXIFICATION 42 isoform X1 [Cajanus cajan]XP_029127840.1 protein DETOXIFICATION 42 isoform X1 [Cajanus cajan]XP_029127841.1 protein DETOXIFICATION 42 isoform X1 [Cajanus cajan]XP_029127842.1 protein DETOXIFICATION 42 isoform X1 [Cajanus cajan]